MRFSGFIGVVFSLFCVLGFNAGRAAEPKFTVQQSPAGVLIRENDRKVLFFQKKPKSLNGRYKRANYVHPLYDWNGDVLSEDFPADHRHHRGVFWAWHQLWLGETRLGDAWSTQDFLADVQSVNIDQTEEDSCTLETRVLWTTRRLPENPDKFLPIVRENAAITIHSRQEKWQLIDFEIRLLALKPNVRLGGSDDRKGYGGFSARIKLPEDLRFRGTEGPVQPKMTAVEAGPWLDFSTKKAGLAILDHPQNPGSPQPWILRRQRSMQNPAYPGRKPVKLSSKTPLVLRYRLVLHDGSLDRKTLDRLQTEWAKTKLPAKKES